MELQDMFWGAFFGSCTDKLPGKIITDKNEPPFTF